MGKLHRGVGIYDERQQWAVLIALNSQSFASSCRSEDFFDLFVHSHAGLNSDREHTKLLKEKENDEMLGRWLVKCSMLIFVLSAVARPADAEETILYCTEQHLVGLQHDGSEWLPSYGDEEFGRRYAIRFSDDMNVMSGVQGGDTVYNCGRYFPTKAPDVVTCINSLVATMVFNFSTESERFLFSLVGPGGWLGETTVREESNAPLADHLIMGQCQEF